MSAVSGPKPKDLPANNDPNGIAANEHELTAFLKNSTEVPTNDVVVIDMSRVKTGSSIEGESHGSMKVFIFHKIQSINVARLFQRLKKLTIFALLIIYFLFFIFSLMAPSKRDQDDTYWCEGDGLLIVINSIAVAGIFYYKVFKVYLSSHLHRYLSPSLKKFRTVTKKRVVKVLLYGSAVLAFCIFLVIDTQTDRSRMVSALGILLIIGIGTLFSASPRHINFEQIIWGIFIQIFFGFLFLRWSVGKTVFQCLGDKVSTFLSFTNAGSSFAFGSFLIETKTYVFAFLTMILFFGMLVNILYYYGILQWMIIQLGYVLEATMGTTPCESMSMAANIFLSLSEAPLVIKPYIPLLTKSELHAVLTGGYSTVTGSVLGAYISFGIDATHLLSASVMSAPAALAMSKLFYPETEASQTKSADIKIVKGKERNVLHAIMTGLQDTLPLIAMIAASLISFIALATFFNAVLGWCCQMLNYEEESCQIQNIFGYLLMPIAWMMGIPASECHTVGYLIGTKLFITQFLSYKLLADMFNAGVLSARTTVITTYALCGFSSIASMGCALGALGSLAPSRMADISQLVFRALIAGNFACFLTACVAGTLIQDASTSELPFNITVVISS